MYFIFIYILYVMIYDFNSFCIRFVSLCLPSPEGTQEVFSLPLQVCTKVQESMKIFAVEMMYRCTFDFFLNAKCFETKGPEKCLV